MKIESTKNIKAQKINALIYGESGVGKTTLASTLAGKTIIISMESGLLSLKKFDIDFVEVDTLSNLNLFLKELEKSDYDNIYIDSLTEANQMFLESSRQAYPEDRQSMKMYGYLLDRMTLFIKYCRDLNKNIFFTALEKTTQDEMGKRFYVPDMVGSISTKCPAYFDFVFNYRIIKQEDKEIRCLVTQKTDNAIAKDRSGRLEMFEQPNLQDIINTVFN